MPLTTRTLGVSFNRLAGNLALASATALALFVAAEAVCRIAYCPENLESVIRFDPTVGWSLRPNVFQRSVDFQRQMDYVIHTNSLGMRDREIRFDNPSHRRRILLIGDSVTFGTGVEAEWRFSDFMQRALGDDYEVINAGVPGWGNDQELLFFETKARKLEPAIVVLTFTMANDVVNNALDHLFLGSAPKPRFVVESDSLRLADRVSAPEKIRHPLWKAVVKRSRFLLFVKRRLDRWAYVRHAHIAGEMGGAVRTDHRLPGGFRPETAGDLTHWSAFESPPSAVVEDAWRVTDALIARFARTCRDHGAVPVVFALPPRIVVDKAWRNDLLQQADLDPSAFDFTGAFDRLSSCCRRNGISFVFPLQEFSHALTTRPLYHPRDSHPGRYGHALAARTLLEYLEKNQDLHFTISAGDLDYMGHM